MDSMQPKRGQLAAVLVLSILAGCQEHRRSSELGLDAQATQAIATQIEAALAQDRVARADSLLAQSGSLEARPALLQYWTGQLALRRGDRALAERAFQLASQSAELVSELALMDLAMLQSARGDDLAAASSCQRLLARHPHHAGAISLRVSSLAELGRLEEARAALQPLADGPERWALAGHLELLAGHPEQALAPLHQLWQAEPASPLANYLYAWALIGVRRPAEALPLLAPLSERDPAFKDAPTFLAQAFEAVGEPDSARAVRQRQSQRETRRRVVELRNQAFELAEAGQLAPALSLLREAEHIAPDDGPLLNDLGAVLTRIGDYAAAEAALLRAAAIAPEAAGVAVNLAQLYMLMGEPEKSREQEERYRMLRSAPKSVHPQTSDGQ